MRCMHGDGGEREREENNRWCGGQSGMEIVSSSFSLGELGGWVSLSSGQPSRGGAVVDQWKGPESAGGFEKFSLIAPNH